MAARTYFVALKSPLGPFATASKVNMLIYYANSINWGSVELASGTYCQYEIGNLTELDMRPRYSLSSEGNGVGATITNFSIFTFVTISIQVRHYGPSAVDTGNYQQYYRPGPFLIPCEGKEDRDTHASFLLHFQNVTKQGNVLASVVF